MSFTLATSDGSRRDARVSPPTVGDEVPGGLIVHQLAVEHPERVTKLVIVGAASTLHGIPALEAETEHIAQLKDPVDPEYVKTAHVAAMKTQVPASRLEPILYVYLLYIPLSECLVVVFYGFGYLTGQPTIPVEMLWAHIPYYVALTLLVSLAVWMLVRYRDIFVR